MLAVAATAELVISCWPQTLLIAVFDVHMQVMAELKDVCATTVFDVLNDPEYRKKWDFTMHDSFDICQISANSDIGYFACMCQALCHFPFVATETTMFHVGSSVFWLQDYIISTQVRG